MPRASESTVAPATSTAQPSRYDVAIVGLGPAGLAAAATLGRSGRSVAVVGTRVRGNAGATEVHNLPYAEGIAPDELYARMERELDNYATAVFAEVVGNVSIDDAAATARVDTADRTIIASRLLLANGVESVVPAWVPAGAWGSVVFECPFCHAYEHRGEDFVVVGRRQSTVDIALLCAVQARTMTVVVADEAAASSKAAGRVKDFGGEVLHDTVDTATTGGSGTMELRTSGGSRLIAGAVLLTGTTRMRSTFVEQLGLAVDEFGIPMVDAAGRASHPLVWVAGTAARPTYVLVEAMGSGIRSAVGIHKDLAHEGLT